MSFCVRQPHLPCLKCKSGSKFSVCPVDMRLHRTAKSEGDNSVKLLEDQDSRTTASALKMSNGLCGDPALDSTDLDSPDPVHKLNAHIHELESQLARLQDERSTLEQDIIDYRTDLLNTRTELYSEMLNSARHQQRTIDDFHTIQKLEARHQRFCSLLVDIGIPRTTVDVLCQVIQSGNGSADDILVNAIKDASSDSSTLLSRLKPIVVGERTPEHYQSALNLTLSVRKELKSQKKRSKFWKRLAQEDGAHANTITPSPSDISSIRQDLTPERQGALNALIARRRTARYTENTDGDVFGGRGRESALDMLVTSLASRPRLDDTRLSSSLSSSTASSRSASYMSYLSGLSRMYRDSTAETPTIPSRLPSSLSTSLRRSSRSSSQSIVLGSINLNVSRSSVGPHDPIVAEGAEENRAPEPAPVPASTVTRSQDLLQNVGRASLRHGHRRVPSTASRRSARSTSSSFRLSATSFTTAQVISQGLGSNDGSTRALRTPDMRLTDLAPISDTPTSSESSGTPFSDALGTPAETQFSPTDTQVESTPLDVDACKPCSRNSRFLEHFGTFVSSASVSASGSMSTSTSTSENDPDGRSHTIPLGESKDSLFTSSSITSSDTPASAPATPTTPSTPPTPPTTGKASRGRSMLPVLAKHLRRLSLSSGSIGPGSPERLVDRLRGLRGGSLSRSPPSPNSEAGWRGSPSASESVCASGSSVKGSGIPVLQRRMTIRARRTSVRKI